jgi:hypothetical protein
MRLTKEQVIARLKAGEPLLDDKVQARFQDGGLCNVFTYWKLRDAGDIKPIYPDVPEPGVYRKWYWDVP